MSKFLMFFLLLSSITIYTKGAEMKLENDNGEYKLYYKNKFDPNNKFNLVYSFVADEIIEDNCDILKTPTGGYKAHSNEILYVKNGFLYVLAYTYFEYKNTFQLYYDRKTNFQKNQYIGKWVCKDGNSFKFLLGSDKLNSHTITDYYQPENSRFNGVFVKVNSKWFITFRQRASEHLIYEHNLSKYLGEGFKSSDIINVTYDDFDSVKVIIVKNDFINVLTLNENLRDTFVCSIKKTPVPSSKRGKYFIHDNPFIAVGFPIIKLKKELIFLDNPPLWNHKIINYENKDSRVFFQNNNKKWTVYDEYSYETDSIKFYTNHSTCWLGDAGNPEFVALLWDEEELVWYRSNQQKFLLKNSDTMYVPKKLDDNNIVIHDIAGSDINEELAVFLCGQAGWWWGFYSMGGFLLKRDGVIGVMSWHGNFITLENSNNLKYYIPHKPLKHRSLILPFEDVKTGDRYLLKSNKLVKYELNE